jgi:hypothetical protein
LHLCPFSVSGFVSRIALIQNVSAVISLLRVRAPVNRIGDEIATTGEKTPPRLTWAAAAADLTGNGEAWAGEFPTPKGGFGRIDAVVGTATHAS